MNERVNTTQAGQTALLAAVKYGRLAMVELLCRLQANVNYPDQVWCGVVWCGVVWCGVVWCGVVWCGVVWCGVVLCCVVWCSVVLCGVVITRGSDVGACCSGCTTHYITSSISSPSVACKLPWQPL